jgi:hypothetical protein
MVIPTMSSSLADTEPATIFTHQAMRDSLVSRIANNAESIERAQKMQGLYLSTFTMSVRWRGNRITLNVTIEDSLSDIGLETRLGLGEANNS